MGSTDFSTMLMALSGSYRGLFSLIINGFWAVGMIMVCWSVFNLKNHVHEHTRHDGRVSPVTKSLVSAAAGSLLMCMPSLLQTIAVTTFGAGGVSQVGLMDYPTATSSSTTVLLALRGFLQLVGVYFVGKGIMGLRSVGMNGDSQEHSWKSVITRLVAGIALVHIVDALKVAAVTFNLGVDPTFLSQMGG